MQICKISRIQMTELFPDIFRLLHLLSKPNRIRNYLNRTEPKIGQVLNGSSSLYLNYPKPEIPEPNRTDTRNAHAYMTWIFYIQIIGMAKLYISFMQQYVRVVEY